MVFNKDNNRVRLLGLGVLFFLMTLLSACVTTETGGLSAKANDAKALDYSIQLAQGYIHKGQWDAAKRHLIKALEIDESSAEVFGTLAVVFQNTGEVELAEEHFKKSLKLDGSSSRARNNYGAFLFSQGRNKEAAEQLEMVVADTLYAKRGKAFVNLGRCYYQLNEMGKAKDAYRRAFLMDRNSSALMFELADVHFLLDDYSKSQQYYDAYRRLVERQPARALWLGFRLAEKFENKDAMSSFALALKNLYPTSNEYLQYKSAFGNDG